VAVETKQPLDTMHARELSALADFKALLAALARQNAIRPADCLPSPD
jgi:hypothetical protein